MKGGRIPSLHWGEKHTSGHTQTVCFPPALRVWLTDQHNHCWSPEGAHYLLHNLEVSCSRKQKCRSFGMRFPTVEDQEPPWHSVTILCPSSREPWARQIPAPCFGSSVLPPSALSDTACMFDIFCLSTPYSDVPPLEIFLQCYLTLASRCSIALLAGCCWQASPMPSSILKSFSDLQGMMRTVLIAFWLRLYVSGQATCLYCSV